MTSDTIKTQGVFLAKIYATRAALNARHLSTTWNLGLNIYHARDPSKRGIEAEPANDSGCSQRAKAWAKSVTFLILEK